MEKVLVTGGAGFIGSHLVHRLVGEGYQVAVLDDFSTGNKANLADVESQIELFTGSILDAELVKQACHGATGIFHLAAIASVPESIAKPIYTHQVNCEAMLHLLACAQKNSARIIFSSTSAVYGDTPAQFKSESDALDPRSPYAVQKLGSEGYLRTYNTLFGVESICLRYFNVFGTRQNPNSEYAAVIPKFLHRAVRGENLLIFGDGTQTRDFVFVSDVVDANLAAFTCESANGQAVNIGQGIATNLNELASVIKKVTLSDSHIIHEPPRAGDIWHSCCTPEVASRVLDWRPKVSLEDGLTLLFQSLR